MEADVTLYRAANENAVAGFETTEIGSVMVVTKAAPIIYKLVMSKAIQHALAALADRGWDVEVVK